MVECKKYLTYKHFQSTNVVFLMMPLSILNDFNRKIFLFLELLLQKHRRDSH